MGSGLQSLGKPKDEGLSRKGDQSSAISEVKCYAPKLNH